MAQTKSLQRAFSVCKARLKNINLLLHCINQQHHYCHSFFFSQLNAAKRFGVCVIVAGHLQVWRSLAYTALPTRQRVATMPTRQKN